jgi:hypothetical protein
MDVPARWYAERMAHDDEEAVEERGIPWENVRAGFAFGVDLAAPYRGPTFGLFDETRDLRPERLDGLFPSCLFGPYRRDRAKFSCVVKDQWDVVTLLRILSGRA